MLLAVSPQLSQHLHLLFQVCTDTFLSLVVPSSPLIAASSYLSPLPTLLWLPSWCDYLPELSTPCPSLWPQVTGCSHFSIYSSGCHSPSCKSREHHTTHILDYRHFWASLRLLTWALGNAATSPVTRDPTMRLTGGDSSTPLWELLAFVFLWFFFL